MRVRDQEKHKKVQKRINCYDFMVVSSEKCVTLHSQIRNGNRSVSDNPYLFRAKKHSQIRNGNRSVGDNPYLFRAKKQTEIR